MAVHTSHSTAGSVNCQVPTTSMRTADALGMVAVNPQRLDLRGVIKPGSMGRAMPGFRVLVVHPEFWELARGRSD